MRRLRLRFSRLSLKCLVFLFLLLSACLAKRQVAQFKEDVHLEVRKVWHEELKKDTFSLPLPEAMLERTVLADSSVLETSLARSKAVVLPSGQLYHSLEHVPKELSVYYPMMNYSVQLDSVLSSSVEQRKEGGGVVKFLPHLVLFLLLVLFAVVWYVMRWKR